MTIASEKTDPLTALKQQRDYFQSGITRPLSFRIQQLHILKDALSQYEGDIIRALQKDLRKPATESFLSEIYLLKQEINFTLQHLSKWVKPVNCKTSFPLNFPGNSYRQAEPYGLSLIIAPWNYPLLMSLLPTIGSIAAGNCIALKPSEIATATEKLLCDMLKHIFSDHYVQVYPGDAKETQRLLQQPFDHIFFTGNPRVGKIVMRYAADHLTPVTLELGGKSPCIIDKIANINHAAKKIIWAKMANAGQTCIAPDFVLIHNSQLSNFLSACKDVIQQFYGNDPKASPDYARIINQHHFLRLHDLLANQAIYFGGDADFDENYLGPTLLHPVSWESSVMQDEIFGPILPIIPYQDLDEIINQLSSKPKPLACYLFSSSRPTIKTLTETLSFGTACINDCLMQITNPHLPFGGVGNSGMGQYRGAASFQTFSHYKNIFHRPSWFNVPLAYPPYSHNKLKWLRRLLRL